MFGLSSFRTQLLLLIAGLLSVVLAAVFIAVNQANQENARLHLEETLSLTSFTFKQDIAARNRVLMEKARLLSGDYAFKKAVATSDHETILSALENHRMRVMADVMMLATLDGEIIADTLHPDLEKKIWPLHNLQRAAQDDPHGESSGIQLLDGKPYQLVIMPLFTPEPSAWIAIGFRITDRFSKQLAEQTNSDVSLIHKPFQNGDKWEIFASTLPKEKQKSLVSFFRNQTLAQNAITTQKVQDIVLQGSPYLSLVQQIQGAGEGETLAVLQRSLNEALKPYLRLRSIMLILFGLGLLFALISAILIARSLSRPLEALTRNVQSIDAGDYQKPVKLKRKDELGTLSKAVNHMSKGLQERDQVRDLLGKVVSPEIARELLNKGIELGGEDRQATILFSDIRKFTSFCEKRNPKDILLLLNRYLGGMSDVIEAHHGVIDKYIGDAIMALFGAPVELDDAPQQAVEAALDMVEALNQLNKELQQEKRTPIEIGIGVNTGQVVAGNMGSSHRMNYTVIGDCVNLASRLEGLTRYFGVSIIVSETTALACPDIPFRQLGRVQVKGKKISIAIFEPLAKSRFENAEFKGLLEQHHEALAAFARRDWDAAQRLFVDLQARTTQFNGAENAVSNNRVGLYDDNVALNNNVALNDNAALMYQLYLDNICLLEQQDLPDDWRGELIFDEK